MSAPTTATAPAPTIARATAWDRGGLVAALAAAFADDPVFAWIEPDAAVRIAALPAFFGGFAEAFARHDASDLARIDGTAVGAALWAPPGVAAVHPDDEEQLGTDLAVLAPAALERLAACLDAFAAVHPDEPAWYLAFLGATPDHQGRGVGSALLRAVLDRCDAAGQPAYLEATSARSRALYQRHGFRCRREIPLPGGPTTYAMWRAPILPLRGPAPHTAARSDRASS